MKSSIYHTVDDLPVVRSVERIINLILSKPELTWAAFIDTAFDYDQGRGRPDFGSFIDCYDFPELQGLKRIAPCLVGLFPDVGLHAQVTRLIKHCQGRPMLSFVGTAASLKDISARWGTMHMVSVVDEQQMLLRFADTRILSYLPQVLTSSQWGAICGAVSHWAYFNRSGFLATCEIPNFHSRPERIFLTKQQLEALLDASHPDALMALIAESMCDIVPADSLASERYCMVKESYELAKRFHANNSADILALAVAAYLTAGESNVDRRLESLLRERAWTVGALGDAIVDAEII